MSIKTIMWPYKSEEGRYVAASNPVSTRVRQKYCLLQKNSLSNCLVYDQHWSLTTQGRSSSYKSALIYLVVLVCVSDLLYVNLPKLTIQ